MKFLDINKIWSYAITATIAFLEPINVLFLWLLIFIMVDFISGIYASLIEGNFVTSHKMQKTVIKFVMYSTALFLLHGIDVYMITFAKLYLARIGCTLICGIELYSIFENCYRITGNPVFKILTQFTLKKIEENTGVSKDELIHEIKKPVRKGRKANERSHK
jgi:phage-related holin